MADTSQNAQWNALKKIVKRLPAHLAYYGSALGAIAIAGSGAEGMASIVGNIGAGLLGNLIADIVKGEDVIDEDIRHRAEDAIHKSDIANLLTKQDFLQGYARLIQRLDAQKTISQDILDELRTGFSKVASADQVEELKRLILQLMQQPPQTATRKTRLFISYARKDDEPFVERLYHDLKDEFDVWWDRETMSNRGKTFLQEIRDAIDWADRLLLVAGPRAFASDYVRDEWLYAYETYKGINITLRLGDYPDLPKQLSGFDAPDFRNDDDYDERLATLKRQLAEPVAPIGAFHNVPALPPHFLNRPEALDALRELVIADVDKPTLISAEKRTTAVEGMGGIGKSVMATAFAHDRKVRFAFPDGIVWLTVGRDAKLYELYRAVGVALGDDLSNYPDETTARQNAQKAIAEKKCLLILDDLWELPVGRAFRDLISGTVTRLLITTRNLQINDLLNANEYRLKLIDQSQAADYLRSWVGDDPDLETIAEKLGYLFLALKLAGARMKKDGLSGTDYLRIFDRVSRMKIGPKLDDREDSLEASITLSVDAAFAGIEDDRLLYHTFGIFQEDTAIPQQTILQLWRYLRPDVDEFELLETLNALVDLALVERHENRTITLHDLLHIYTREKLGGRCIQTHQDLLESYRGKKQTDAWHKVADEGYLYDHLVYHLQSAEAYSDLEALFADQDWMRARFEQCGYTYRGYVDDLMAAWAVAQRQAERQIESGEEPAAFVQCLRYALICTSVNSLASNYVPELVAKAVEIGLWSAKRALSVAANTVDADARAHLYQLLLSTGKLGQEEVELAQQAATSAALASYDKRNQLAKLLPYMTELQKQRVLHDELAELIETRPDGSYQIRDVDTLVMLVPHLDHTMVEKCLTIGLQNEKEEERAKVIQSLAPYLSKPLVLKALESAFALADKDDRVHTLVALVPYLEPDRKAQTLKVALELAWSLDDQIMKSRALIRVIPLLDDIDRHATVTASVELVWELREVELVGPIQEPYISWIAERLHDLRSYLKSKDVVQCLEHFSKVKHPYAKAAILGELLPVMSVEQREACLAEVHDCAIAVAQEVDWFYSGRILAKLYAYLLSEHKDDAWSIALKGVSSQFFSDNKRESFLKAVGPHIEDRHLQICLNYISSDKSLQNSVLAVVANRLSIEQLEQFLSASRVIEDIGNQVVAIAPYSIHLSRDQSISVLDKCFGLAMELPDKKKSGLGPADFIESRWEAFTSLVSVVEEGAFDRIVELAFEHQVLISLDRDMRQLFFSLLPRASEEQRRRIFQESAYDMWFFQKIPMNLISYFQREWAEYLLAVALCDAKTAVDVKGEVIVFLTPFLDDELTSNIASRVQHHYRHIQDNQKILQYLNKLTRAKLLKIALDAALPKKERSANPDFLAHIAPYLPDALIKQVVKRILSVDYHWKDGLLAAIAPHVADEMIGQVLDASNYDVQVLLAIALRSKDNNREQYLKQALESTLCLKDFTAKTELLLAIVPHLERQAKAQALQAGIDAARNATGEYKWECGPAQALMGYLPFVENKEEITGEIHLTLLSHLSRFADQQRSWLLMFIARSELFSPPIFSSHTSVRIIRELIEICWGWEWL